MKIFFYIVAIILFISILFICKFFYFYLPSKRLEYQKYILELTAISKESVNILNNDETVQKLSKNHLVFSDCWVNVSCEKEADSYLFTRQKIPEKIAFYRCDSIFWALFVREEKNKFLENYIFSYHVYSSSPWKIQLTGISFSKNSDSWLEYDQYFDLWKYDPCYPWNNLENYWKIYGKATPEEIQAVIDQSKNSH